MKSENTDTIYEKDKYNYFVLKEEVSEKTYDVKITKQVSAKVLECIIIDAIESGLDYWAGIDNSNWNKPAGLSLSQYAAELILTGKEVKFYDIEENGEDEDWILTLDKLLKGIALNEVERPFDCDLSDYDSSTVDCIIQFALFGEIVYS